MWGTRWVESGGAAPAVGVKRTFREFLAERAPWLRPVRDEWVYQVKRPYRYLRKVTVPLRGWPALPGRRVWRSSVPNRLHVSIMRGQLGYTYRGMRCLRNPFDLALYLLILQELRPRTIIEVGTKEGGHAAWLGDMLNVLDIPGRVYSIDIAPPDPVYQPWNVEIFQGDENDLGAVWQLPWEAAEHPWFVILDASHHYAGTKNSLSFLNRRMVRGDLLVVEDGYITELGEDGRARHGGPARAIAEFLAYAKDWRIESRYCDFYGHNVTANPNGYLVRQ